MKGLPDCQKRLMMPNTFDSRVAGGRMYINPTDLKICLHPYVLTRSVSFQGPATRSALAEGSPFMQVKRRVGLKALQLRHCGTVLVSSHFLTLNLCGDNAEIQLCFLLALWACFGILPGFDRSGDKKLPNDVFSFSRGWSRAGKWQTFCSTDNLCWKLRLSQYGFSLLSLESWKWLNGMFCVHAWQDFAHMYVYIYIYKYYIL